MKTFLETRGVRQKLPSACRCYGARIMQQHLLHLAAADPRALWCHRAVFMVAAALQVQPSSHLLQTTLHSTRREMRIKVFKVVEGPAIGHKGVVAKHRAQEVLIDDMCAMLPCTVGAGARFT